MFKIFKNRALVFVLFEDTQYGYRAFESRYSIMASAQSQQLLVEEIKKQVHKHFDGKFYGKIVLRKFVDEEISDW